MKERCTRCFGRGYIPKYRDYKLGFYARPCYLCGGVGERETSKQRKKEDGK